MAFQTRTRDPLFDEATQAALNRRARELIGLALLAAGTVLALALGSYSPADPSFLGSSSAPPSNLLGHFGAYLAAPLYVILGYGAWAIVAVALVWGARFMTHRGEDRGIARLIFAPMAVALASVYAATHVPGPAWQHSFGLGGLFGDTALGVILGILPISPAAGLIVAAVGFLLGMLSLGLFALGVTRAELRGFRHFLGYGTLFAVDAAVRAVGRGAAGGRQRLAARRASRADDDDDVLDDDDVAPVAAFAPAAPVASRGRAPAVARSQPAAPLDAADDDDVVDDDAGAAAPKPGLLRSLAGKLKGPASEAPAPRGRVQPVVRAQPPLLSGARAAARPVPEAELAWVEDDDDDMPDVAVSEGREGVARTRVNAPSRLDGPPLADADAEDELEDAAPEAGASQLGASQVAQARPPQVPKAAERRPRVEHSRQRKPQPSDRAKAEAQPSLQFDPEDAAYAPPPLSLLRDPATVERHHLSDDALEENARLLETVLSDYGVKGEIVSVRPGPVVTMYELEPAPGLKASRVIGLADDIARSMMALSARVSTVPGRSVIGIELPNDNREMVLLREVLSARDFDADKVKLPLALGKTIGGESVIANLAKMPHLLVAGTTGSGKSVTINTMILSLLYKLTPDECRLIMIDPKMLELSVYDDIPHLLSPVVTDPKKAVVALKWVVAEMEDRYRKMSKMGVRNIEGYNSKVRATLDKGEMFSRTVQTGFDDETGEPVFETEEFAPETLPYIVVIVDEMADLMMVAGKEIDACVQRLAQMARASGIHLIMATQRPSVDVITGTIKANFPTRISFQVTSKIDSRTILGEQGAEQLLGMGDMLYMEGGGKVTRLHAPFVSDQEVEDVVAELKAYGPPQYVGNVAEGPDDSDGGEIDQVLGLGGNTNGDDALYDQAVQIAIKDRKCSTSYIQRKLAIGYNKAARLVEQMEDQGVVSAANHVGKREVLVGEQ